MFGTRPHGGSPRVLRPFFGGALLVLSLVLALACTGAPPAPSGSPAGNKPLVVVQQPASGALLGTGQTAVVSGAASDTIGVARVELLVDGVSVAGVEPAGTPSLLLPFSFNWIAVAGIHTLQVTAYRADGTASDPAVIQVNVGATASGLPGASFLSFAPVPTLAPPSAARPDRTRRPRRSRMPSIAPTDTPTNTPTTAPTATPTTAPTATPTIDPGGTAPDDSAVEPHPIVLVATNPACPPGPPAAAVGCITEQISAPGGDTTDDLYFVPVANTSYQLKLTACSDTSDATVLVGGDPSIPLGCGDWFNVTTGPTAPAQVTVTVRYGTVASQTYNQYQFTVYQCTFANCGNS